jgi:hypothetical protein
MLGQEFYSNQQTKTFCYVSIHLEAIFRACVFIHCFRVFGYPGETLALAVPILLLSFSNFHVCSCNCISIRKKKEVFYNIARRNIKKEIFRFDIELYQHGS